MLKLIVPLLSTLNAATNTDAPSVGKGTFNVPLFTYIVLIVCPLAPMFPLTDKVAFETTIAPEEVAMIAFEIVSVPLGLVGSPAMIVPPLFVTAAEIVAEPAKTAPLATA